MKPPCLRDHMEIDQTDGQTDGWMDGWVEGWKTDGWMEGWMPKELQLCQALVPNMSTETFKMTPATK